jgi:hypothetical protein
MPKGSNFRSARNIQPFYDVLRLNQVNRPFMERKHLPYAYFAFLFTILLLAGSCRKFDGEQTVPAFIRIDTITLSTEYFSEGANTHNISDAWVYVNGQLIGAFELPAVFPVLAKGLCKVEIRPGIKLNGISATRAHYPFYKPYEIETMLSEDSITKINPFTSYYNTSVFAWLEDFEGSSISLVSTSKSDTIIEKTQPANHPDAFLSEYSAYSGKVHLTGDIKVFEISSFNGYVLPGRGSPVFVEIDYKCNRGFGVGVFIKKDNTILTFPLIVVNKSDIWKKIYINLSPIVTEYANAEYVKVYFDSDLGTDATEALYYFDNLKIVYRNNP